tara:strand:+ start:3603 stop:3830 length:228 start_codon:yes stop_codon:yes gene_type:complete
MPKKDKNKRKFLDSVDEIVDLLKKIDQSTSRMREIEEQYLAGDIKEEVLVPITKEVYEEMQLYLSDVQIRFMGIA